MFVLSSLIHYAAFSFFFAYASSGTYLIGADDWMEMVLIGGIVLYPAFLLYHLIVWALMRATASMPLRMAIQAVSSLLFGAAASALYIGKEAALFPIFDLQGIFVVSTLACLVSLTLCLTATYRPYRFRRRAGA